MQQNSQTNPNNITNSGKINTIETIIQSQVLDINEYGCVLSLIETEDKRIASGSKDGIISISSYDVNESTWNIDIQEKKAHNGGIYSLCTLNGNRLLSGGIDYSIKLWTLSNVELTLIKDIKEHTNVIYKVIPLSKERFASCSIDNTVKIWKDDNTCKCVSTLYHNNSVRSILQLKSKEVLVSCGWYSSTGVSFWNLNTYTQEHNIQGFSVYWSTHMIELSNGNIAISSQNEPYPIVIIDSTLYQVVTMIQLNEYIIGCSSLCIFNEHSFILVYDGKFLQISNKDYSVLFHSKGEIFNGYYGVIPIEGGKYFAIESDGVISVIKPSYI